LAEHQGRIKALEEQREKLEGEVSRRSAGYYRRPQMVTLPLVQSAIPSKGVLIEFAVYRPFDPKPPSNTSRYGDPRYVAYVIRNQGPPRWTDIGPAKEIDARVEALREALRDPERNDVRQLARAVDDKVMMPIRQL